jgi:hypothetical protein
MCKYTGVSTGYIFLLITILIRKLMINYCFFAPFVCSTEEEVNRKEGDCGFDGGTKRPDDVGGDIYNPLEGGI